jgi:uncharacterized protein (TIGR03437 family)
MWSAFLLPAQPAQDGDDILSALEWTPFGNTRLLAGVAGYASGPVSRVWRHADRSVSIALDDGSTYTTVDFLSWTASNVEIPPPAGTAPPPDAPRDAWLVLPHPTQPMVVYALGHQVYRSLDGGRSFAALSRFRGVSLLGESLRDLALNAQDPDDLLVASELGLWRSRDGGLSWIPASDGLDNLPMTRILAFPEGTRGLVVQQPSGALLEWLPGAVHGWRFRAHPADERATDARASGDFPRKPAALNGFGNRLTAWDAVGPNLYVGLSNGRLLASGDEGRTWRSFASPDSGAPRQLIINPADARMALALVIDAVGQARLMRTLNGGLFWDDLSPATTAPLEAIAPDWDHNAIVLLDERQLVLASFDFRGAAPPNPMRQLARAGLPDGILDLRTDPSGTLLYAVSQRHGVFYAPMPSAGGSRKLRHAADLSQRPAAPGDLLSLHGAPVRALRANGRPAPVLATAPQATQVQLPYDVTGTQVTVDWESGAGAPSQSRLTLQRVSPAIFLHPDGSPFVLHADTGALVDENLPAAPGQRIQVMVSGLGAVRPDWPAGLPVPAEAPPQVVAAIEARLDQVPLRVERATLAPGYTGIYLVEVVLPALIDEGLRELRVIADGISSNPVAIHAAYP